MNSESVDLSLPAWPAFVVHGLDQARDVLALGRPVLLLSAPGVVLSGGCGWWRALVDAAKSERPDATAIDILDCADAPGAAMAALRHGQRHLVLLPHVPAFARVAAAASSIGAVVLPSRPPALDLSERDTDRRRWDALLSQR